MSQNNSVKIEKVNPNDVARNLIESLSKPWEKGAPTSSQQKESTSSNANRDDFQKLVAARLHIMHPEGRYLKVNDRPFKETRGLPIRFNADLPFRLRFESKKADGSWTHAIYEGREGKLFLESFNPAERKNVFIEAGTYECRNIETKAKVMVPSTKQVLGEQITEDVEVSMPALELGNGKKLASSGFVCLLQLHVTIPVTKTIAYVVYNAAPMTVQKNRKQYNEALDRWMNASDEFRHINRDRAPHLAAEAYLLRQEHIDLVVTGNTLFKGFLVDPNGNVESTSKPETAAPVQNLEIPTDVEF